MLISATPPRSSRAPAPTPPQEDPGQVYVTGDGFVQNFGCVVSATGTLRLFDSGVAWLLAKDIELQDGIRLHGDAVQNTVTVSRPDGATIEFQDSELKLPYQEKDSNHAVFELRSHRSGNPSGFVEDVYSDGGWNLTHYQFVDGNREDQALAWRQMPLEQRWQELQRFADLSNAQA